MYQKFIIKLRLWEHMMLVPILCLCFAVNCFLNICIINLVQPVKIIDPHLVSTFFDGYKRVYLHATTEFENKGSWVAGSNLNIQVTLEQEDGIFLVEHVQTQHVSIPAGKTIQLPSAIFLSFL